MIKTFTDEYAFLSNFYPSEIQFGSLVFPTVEHAYQAAKSEDIEIRRYISHLKTPAEAKRYGRKITLRILWEKMKRPYMSLFVITKFTEHKDLQAKLLATEDNELIEGNYWHDNFWGACYCQHCLEKEKYNHLGKILMSTRQMIINKGGQK